MSRKIAKLLSVLLLATAIAVTQIPVSDVEAAMTASDFQMDGMKLLRYTGTAEVVSIPDGIKEIGEEAFAGNDYLVKVTIGGDVEKVGYRAFADCDSLRTIQVGDSVQELETAAFSNNKSLKNVTLGASVRKIGSGVFAGSSRLSGLSISDANTFLTFEDGILYDDERKVIYAMLPDYDKGMYTMPGSVEEIKAYAFWGNPYLEFVKTGSGLTNVSAYAFSNCMNLKEVDMPLPVRTIEAKAFEDCVNLRNVVVPESVNHINETAFDGCSKVEITAVPGSYGEKFANELKDSEVEQIEYEDTADTTVINPEQLTEEDTQHGGSDVPKETEKPDTEEQELPVEVHTISGSYSSERLLGQSSIVAGRAVVFIDNGTTNTGNVVNSQIDLTIDHTDTTFNDSDKEQIGSILSDKASKGKDFPKYTVVGDKIASQAYYQDASLKEYTIGEEIHQIGEFAFARSNLTSIVIPDGVEKIGYGAFYHCDNLSEVSIPDSVQEIAANAFEKTPWLTAQNAQSAYVIVGDGILISYNGSDSIINIPGGVKQIGAEVFKDHMGITAVNIPDSVEVIGENAFLGCKNLTTVNGGANLIKIGAGAFRECPLSKVLIPASVKEIGIGAYDFSGGTDTAVFEGGILPVLTYGDSTARLANTDARAYALGGVSKVIVPNGTTHLNDTILESGTYGFKGLVYDEAGNLLTDSSDGASQQADNGVVVQIASNRISAGKENTMATLPGNEENFVLKIQDDAGADAAISAAYSELYGGRSPSDLLGFDITLYDSTGQVPITKLGKQYITVMIPLPAGYRTSGLHMVTLDEDGQLEAVEHQIVNLSDGDYIQFSTSHFSPFGIYKYSGYSGQAVVTNGSAYVQLSGKDDTPDTGDGMHPKWILAIGLFATSVALFFYKGKKVKLKR